MEINVIHNPLCEHLSQEELIKRVTISKVIGSTMEKANDFLFNNATKLVKVPLDDCFICSLQDNGNDIILGAFVYTENDIRTKIRVEGNDELPRNYHELLHLVIDERLLDEHFLIKSFRKMFQLLAKEDDSQEVFWMEQRQILYSRVTDAIIKKYERYYYQNEAEYFSAKILQIFNNK